MHSMEVSTKGMKKDDTECGWEFQKFNNKSGE